MAHKVPSSLNGLWFGELLLVSRSVVNGAIASKRLGLEVRMLTFSCRVQIVVKKYQMKCVPGLDFHPVPWFVNPHDTNHVPH